MKNQTPIWTTCGNGSPALAFNLRAMGFRNHAARELNILTLLEILHTPYSGADPACMSVASAKVIVRAVIRGLGIPANRQRESRR